MDISHPPRRKYHLVRNKTHSHFWHILVQLSKLKPQLFRNGHSIQSSCLNECSLSLRELCELPLYSTVSIFKWMPTATFVSFPLPCRYIWSSKWNIQLNVGLQRRTSKISATENMSLKHRCITNTYHQNKFKYEQKISNQIASYV